MKLVELFGGISVSSSIALHCTGILTCKQIISKGNVGTMSHIPFLSAALMGGTWAAYGVLVSMVSLILVNLFIAIIQSSYFIVYYLYSKDQSNILRRDGLVVVVLFLSPVLYCYYVIWYSLTSASHEVLPSETAAQISFFMGMVCNLYTVLFFASPLSTMSVVIKNKETSSMSLSLSFTSAINAFSWTIYGVLVMDRFVEVSNMIGFFLAIVQLSLFVVYPRDSVEDTPTNLLSTTV